MSSRDVLIRILTQGDASGAQEISSSLDQVAERAEALGRSLTLRVTAPLAALGGLAVRAYAIQEQAERRLQVALKATGQEVDANFNRMAALASELQRVTTFGDEGTLQAMAFATQLGVQADQMEEVIKGAMGMSSMFGMDLNTAIRMVTLAQQGNYDMLTRYIPELRDATDEAEKAAIVQRTLAIGFEQAKADAETLTGALQNMKNSSGDLLEQIGEQLAPGVRLLAGSIQSLAESAQALPSGFTAMGVGAGVLAAALPPAIWASGALIRNFRTLHRVAPTTAIALRNLSGVLAAFGVGFTLGTVLDELTGFSDKVAEIHAGWSAMQSESTDAAATETQGYLNRLKAAEDVAEAEKVRREIIRAAGDYQQRSLAFHEAGNQRLAAQYDERARQMRDLASTAGRMVDRIRDQGDATSDVTSATEAQAAAQEETVELTEEQLALLREQEALRASLTASWELDNAILQARIDGNEDVLAQLREERRERQIIEQLKRGGITEEEAVSMARERVSLERQAADAEERRNREREEGIRLTREGTRVATEGIEAERRLREGVRSEQYYDMAGQRQTRYFEGGRLINEDQAFEGPVAVSPAAAPARPNAAPSSPSASADLSPVASAIAGVKIDVAPVVAAVTRLQTDLQGQITQLASRIQELGN